MGITKMKKILLTFVAVAAVAVGVVGMSAFEAHVINVTAKIENALNVPIDEIADSARRYMRDKKNWVKVIPKEEKSNE